LRAENKLIGEEMSAFARYLITIVLFCAASLCGAANLPPGHSLYQGQGIYSDDGRYLLIMQADGNLVYYRTIDWAVRWASSTNGRGGYVAQMQSDGNFVVYNSGWGAIWNSATQNHPGAYLVAQNDGNLVIYWNGQALWNIGVDPELNKPEPRQAGDVVGRTLASFISFPGHIGYYDGSNIYQVMNEAQVVQYVSVANFKAPVASQGPSAYWGAGYPNIPIFYVKGCFETNCTNNLGQVWDSRSAMNLRAFQIWKLGAKYTLSTSATPALPRTGTTGAQQGLYRCDTYVLDIYSIFTAGGQTDIRGNPIQDPNPDTPYKRWVSFRMTLQQATLPTVVFQLLKTYRG
jgi:hypothetical protein